MWSQPLSLEDETVHITTIVPTTIIENSRNIRPDQERSLFDGGRARNGPERG
jgi:hypothetical protein